MSTSNPHTDATGAFWTGDHDAPSYQPPETQIEDVEADARQAYKEAQGKAEREDEIKPDDIDVLSHDFGTVKGAAEYGLGTTRAYKVNPVAAGERHHRDYTAWPPKPMPEREPPAQPPAELTDPQALYEWHLTNDIRESLRTAPVEQARKQQLAEARPVLAEAAKELGTSEGQLLQQLAGVHLAMRTNPNVATDKITKWFIPEAQKNQRLADREQWLDQVGASLPGYEREDVRGHMANFIGHLNKTNQRTGDDAVDVRIAHEYATKEVQKEAAAEQAKIAAKEAKAAAAKARQASRSVSGSSSSSDMRERDLDGGSVEDSARSAWRSVSGNRV